MENSSYIAIIEQEIIKLKRQIKQQSTANIGPPMCGFGRDCRFSGHYGGGYGGAYAGGTSLKYECLAVKTLADINGTLRTLCARIEYFCVALGVNPERVGALSQFGTINSGDGERPMEAVQQEAAVVNGEALIGGKKG